MSKSRKRRRKKAEAINRMVDDTTEVLEKIRDVLAAITSITSSLQVLATTYRQMQDDGNLDMALSVLQGRHRHESRELADSED